MCAEMQDLGDVFEGLKGEKMIFLLQFGDSVLNQTEGEKCRPRGVTLELVRQSSSWYKWNKGNT